MRKMTDENLKSIFADVKSVACTYIQKIQKHKYTNKITSKWGM